MNVSLPQQWLDKANEDLIVARLVRDDEAIEAADNILHYVEKLLKLSSKDDQT